MLVILKSDIAIRSRKTLLCDDVLHNWFVFYKNSSPF